MTATAKQIFRGFTDPAQITITDSFSGVDFLVINAIGYNGDQFEIAALVELRILADTELLNGFVSVPQDLGTKEIPLNVSFFDTAVIVPLPIEATRSNCECRVNLSTSYSVNLEIYAVSKEVVCECENELREIKEIVEFLRAVNIGIALNQLAQDAAILGIAGTVGVALAPFTGGTSLALPGAVSGALSAGTGAIVPVLVGSGLTLPLGI